MTKFNTNESHGRLVGTAFVIIGSLVAVAGLIWLIWTAGFVSRATKAIGQIIAMERSEGSEGGPIYQPVFTFTDSGGISHTQRSSSSTSEFSFEIGDRVTVLYDSATPKHSKIESFETVWLGPLVVTGFGLLGNR